MSTSSRSADLPNDGWGVLMPFGGAAVPGSEFPVACLPDWVSEHVAAVALATQTPVDLAGVLGLAALSVAAGGRVVVEVDGSWREPVNLFCVVALPPANRKSGVFRAMTEPLRVAERGMAEHAAPMIAEAKARRGAAIAMARAKQSKSSEAKTDETQEAAIREAAEAARTAESVTVPEIPRLLADDATPEALVSLLADHGGRIAVLSAEGGIFEHIAGRYSGVPNLDPYLKAHAGDTIRVDRKGRPPEYVDAPALTVGVTVQPAVLMKAAGRPGFRGMGLLARFLYAVPESIVGKREIRPPAEPAEVRDAYAERLIALVTSLAEWTPPNQVVLTLTPQADQILVAWERELEPQLANGARLGEIDDWAGKLAGATVRVAGLLHLAHHHGEGWAKPIDADVMSAAAAIARYFLVHALVAFDLMGANDSIARVSAVAVWISENIRGRFTERDCFQSHRSLFRTMDELRPVLVLLEESNWIRRAPEEPRRVPRRPGRPSSPAYEINPAAGAASMCSTYPQSAQPPEVGTACTEKSENSEGSDRLAADDAVPTEVGRRGGMSNADAVALIVDTFTTPTGERPTDESLSHCPSCARPVVPAPGSVQLGWSTYCTDCDGMSNIASTVSREDDR